MMQKRSETQVLAPPRRIARPAPLGSNQAWLHRLAPRLQPKLEIGAVNDPAEQEADHAAARVMSAEATSTAPPALAASPRRLSRKCGTCEEKETGLQMKQAGGPSPAQAPPSVQAALGRPGRALDSAAQAFFAPRFGNDFSGVRIHDDAEAARSAQDIGARAYTVGRHIAFAPQQYAPYTATGRQLLAHELAHVVQQGHDPAAPLRRDPPPGATPPPAAAPPPATAPQPAVADDPLVQKFLIGQATPADQAALQQKFKANQISAKDLKLLSDFAQAKFAEEFRKAITAQITSLTGGTPPAGKSDGGLSGNVQIGPGGVSGNLNIGGGTITLGGPSPDTSGAYHTYLKTSLRVSMAGAAKDVAEGLAGSVDTMIEVNAAAGADSGTITLNPPGGDTALAKNIVAAAFPTGAIKLPIEASLLKWIRRGNILGTVSLTVSGPGGSPGPGLSLQTELLPKGVTLTLSISQSSDRPTLAPSTGDPALPGPRVFGTVGGGSSGGKPAGVATVGFDLPLVTDTAHPYIYGGLGLRGTADTTGSLAGLGAGIVGLHISPITLQLAIEAGIGRAAPGTGAAGSTAGTGQATFASGAEGSVSYKILQHVEIMALASVLGGTHMPAAGTLQAGIGGVF